MHGTVYTTSIGAFTWPLEQRNYRLVGCMRAGFNAFFVRNDARQGNLSPPPPAPPPSVQRTCVISRWVHVYNAPAYTVLTY